MKSAALAALLGAAACSPAPAPPRSVRRQTIEGLTLNQSDDGRPSWTLRSRLAELREDANSATLEAPTMEFYRDGRAVSRVTALAGEIATDTHDVKLSSSVVLDSFEDHSVLTTDSLFYSSKAKLFRTNSDVVVRRPEGVAYGRGMEATPDLSEIRIFHQRSVLKGRPQ
ncbi:MAG TPA: LPS export ABC transporter periplasmic protein LptC [Elusimicrobiota bacterium]|nr:LPS export ABC transporter periplasmic protein LptC [Elusimicrobiota bacterium]